ncbi:4-(cytidine 5'-diphospho)-2-C-methyl-D-erythritol kinase [Salinibacillus xinjiangensis]|uniref:4-diphosphocytidyl-2-C-methyl-D-erythritol kinase n=1 Tax=Salinibacillus xinjiangensis TaxID=1229268 RepID=A0A6G1XBB5_9BACI|nr:4-(cytidine 5'-diphospho)-2-C-methyl-D-erythritol kinase [Salinibacillus xinjiangensis]MRG88170.1 4-(cytidine 5'-diphospho)-2-C-methyl-D-erythritol kinase [Salinibacillus xinjiangensis]
MLLEKAPAKINLTLDVLHKRDDGYHEVEMVMTTVDLYDQIQLSELNKDTIQIYSEKRYVPDDYRNLAYQAAELIKSKFNIQTGIKISIFKQIPVAAGLAGGSSDAAAVLRGLNTLWNLGLSYDQLAEIGTEIGSDVAFCVYGGTALAKGRGEQIEKLPSVPSCWVILAKPTIGVSTKSIYERLNLNRLNRINTEAMITAIKNGDYQGMYQNLGNVMESVTLDMHPEIKQIKEQMIQSGADNVLMSGSGPTVFGLTRKQTRAERIYNSLRGFCEEVYVVRMLG